MSNAEWEYKVIERMAPRGRCFGAVDYAQFNTEGAARITFWYQRQNEIMAEVKPLLDEGWEPVTEIGPGCLIVKTSAEYSKGVLQTLHSWTAAGYDWWLIGMRIELRRRRGSVVPHGPVSSQTGLGGNISFCTNCGAQLPENARFCSSCGSQIARDPAPVLEPHAKSEKPIETVGDAIERTKRLVKHYMSLARTGTVTDDTIEAALKFREFLAKTIIFESLVSELGCFAVADSLERHFRQRYLSSEHSRKDRNYVRLLEQDWVLIHEDIDKLLRFSGIEGQSLSDYRIEHAALYKWLEEKILKYLLLSRFLAGYKMSKKEMSIFITRFDERAKSAIDYATQILALTKRG